MARKTMVAGKNIILLLVGVLILVPYLFATAVFFIVSSREDWKEYARSALVGRDQPFISGSGVASLLFTIEGIIAAVIVSAVMIKYPRWHDLRDKKLQEIINESQNESAITTVMAILVMSSNYLNPLGLAVAIIDMSLLSWLLWLGLLGINIAITTLSAIIDGGDSVIVASYVASLQVLVDVKESGPRVGVNRWMGCKSLSRVKKVLQCLPFLISLALLVSGIAMGHRSWDSIAFLALFEALSFLCALGVASGKWSGRPRLWHASVGYGAIFSLSSVAIPVVLYRVGLVSSSILSMMSVLIILAMNALISGRTRLAWRVGYLDRVWRWNLCNAKKRYRDRRSDIILMERGEGKLREIDDEMLSRYAKRSCRLKKTAQSLIDEARRVDREEKKANAESQSGRASVIYANDYEWSLDSMEKGGGGRHGIWRRGRHR